MFGTGGSALIGKTLGEGDRQKANRMFSLFVYITIILSVVVSAACFILLEDIAALLGAEGEMLKESVLLITDYSSVFFDFGYMRKPVVYYQFDEDVFYSKHYKKGYFDYRQMGFGDVSTSEDDAIVSLLRICQNGMRLEPKYLERIKNFFPLYDTNNCKRIYDVIAKDNNEE